MDAFTPPIWSDGGNASFFLGTDQQGRDMFSTMIYGSRISLIVGFASIIFAMILGVFLGLHHDSHLSFLCSSHTIIQVTLGR